MEEDHQAWLWWRSPAWLSLPLWLHLWWITQIPSTPHTPLLNFVPATYPIVPAHKCSRLSLGTPQPNLAEKQARNLQIFTLLLPSIQYPIPTPRADCCGPHSPSHSQGTQQILVKILLSSHCRPPQPYWNLFPFLSVHSQYLETHFAWKLQWQKARKNFLPVGKQPPHPSKNQSG